MNAPDLWLRRRERFNRLAPPVLLASIALLGTAAIAQVMT